MIFWPDVSCLRPVECFGSCLCLCVSRFGVPCSVVVFSAQALQTMMSPSKLRATSKRDGRAKLESLSLDELSRLVEKLEKKKKKQNKPSAQQLFKVAVHVPPALNLNVVTFGSACTGWASEAQACADLGLSSMHVFACDNAAASRRFVTTNFDIGQWFPDVFDPGFCAAPYVDIFSAGFPCQPYSTEGKGCGMADARAHVIEPVLQYIMNQSPRAVLLENVLGLIQKEHIDVADTIVGVLRKKYKVFMKVLNSQDFGVPHHRPRVFIIALRRDAFTGQWVWPESVPCVQLSACLDKGAGSPRSPTHHKNISSCVQDIKEKMQLNAWDHHFIFDVGTGRGPRYMKDTCPCITTVRGRQSGFFSTKTKALLSVMDFARLQGCTVTRYDWSMLRNSEIGHLAGNAMTINVIQALLMRICDTAALRHH